MEFFPINLVFDRFVPAGLRHPDLHLAWPSPPSAIAGSFLRSPDPRLCLPGESLCKGMKAMGPGFPGENRWKGKRPWGPAFPGKSAGKGSGTPARRLRARPERAAADRAPGTSGAAAPWTPICATGGRRGRWAVRARVWGWSRLGKVRNNASSLLNVSPSVVLPEVSSLGGRLGSAAAPQVLGECERPRGL